MEVPLVESGPGPEVDLLADLEAVAAFFAVELA